MKLNPGDNLRTEEREFVHAVVLMGYGKAEAYRHAMRDQGVVEDMDPNVVTNKAVQLEKKVGVKRYEAWIRDADEMDVARAVYRSTLLNSGSMRDKKAAADALVKIQEKEEEGRQGAGKWLALMRDLDDGAEVEIPIPIGATHVRVKFDDFVDGRAHLTLPLAAKIDLLHKAGAPWSEDDPDAKLHPLQIEMLGRQERTKILHGGSGLGKSALGACEAICALMIPRGKIAIVADTYDHCYDEFKYIYEGWCQLFGYGADCGKAISVNSRTNHHMEIATIWGASVTCISTDKNDGDSLLGKEYDLIILGEGAKVKADVYRRKAKRALNRRIKRREGYDYYRQTGRACMYTTADGFKGASSEEWDSAVRLSGGKPEALHVGRAESWLSSYYLREASVEEAPHYSREALADAIRTLPADIVAEQYFGKRVRRSGLIYKEFDPEVHVIALPDSGVLSAMKFSVSFDTGKHFSSGLHGYHPDKTILRLGEFCSVEENMDMNCFGVKHMLLRVLGRMAGIGDVPHIAEEEKVDAAYAILRPRIDEWWVDGRSQSKLEIMQRMSIGLADSDLQVQGSIDQLRGLMRENRFFVCRDECYEESEQIGFLYEIKDYVWRVVKEGNAQSAATRSALEPIKINDHSMDDTRYGVIPLIEAGPPAASETVRSTFDQQWNQAQGLQGLHASLRARMRGEGEASDIGQAYRNVHGLH